ncbi:cyclic nucleotide-gated channel alpha-3-like isoform X2 [Montipora capricornis]|uniref:cyclic nucleotide-gated channel alpha-3-like isoform X2 n=1 Tax=Montipora capricornis TaxID=246305 RepID=UPI0035F1288B
MMEKAVRFVNKDDSADDEKNARKIQQRKEETTAATAASKRRSNGGNLKFESVESMGRWRGMSKQIRSAFSVGNAVRPSRVRRRGSTWRSPVTVDPFLQKFSTRESRKVTPPHRKRSRAVSKKNSSDNKQPKSNHFDTAESTTIEIEKEMDSELTTGSMHEYDHAVHWKDKTVVFDPDCLQIYVWFYVLVFAIRYNLWTLIMRIAFPEAQSGWLKITWFVFDYFCDVIYFLDIVIAARTGFLEEGILVTETKRVSKRYFCSVEFIADTASLIPTDLLYAAFGPVPLLRLNRLVKAYKSFRIKSAMESQANYPTFLRVFFLMHLMFLIIHWNAGFYFMVSRLEGFGTNKWVYQGNGSLYQQYLQSVYWSTLTLTTIGDLPQPTTNLEYLYTTACYLTGVFMFATIVGNAGSIIVNRNAVRMDFEKQRDNTKQYMKKHNVPKDLQRRVVMWYDYSWARGRMSTGGGDLNSLTLLPNKLKTEIALHVNLETLKKVTFLQKCQPEFLHQLVLKMQLRIFTPGDLVCKKGEVARDMYVIINGKIEVTGDQGQVLKVLSGGDFFGEIGILSLSEGQNRRTADVRTVGYVECFVLSKEDVVSAVRDYPEAQAVLAEYGKRRLERQNSAQDPRLVDMDDDHTISPDGKSDITNRTPKRKRSSLRSLSPKNELNKDTTANSLSNGRCKSPAFLPLGQSSHPPGRAILLEPIAPKLRREKRLSSEPSEMQQSLPIYNKDESDDCRNGDVLITNMFNKSCMEAFNFLKKAYEENLTKQLKDVSTKLKDMEESKRQKDEKISRLKCHLTDVKREIIERESRVKELESDNFIKEQTIKQLLEQLEVATS